MPLEKESLVPLDALAYVCEASATTEGRISLAAMYAHPPGFISLLTFLLCIFNAW